MMAHHAPLWKNLDKRGIYKVSLKKSVSNLQQKLLESLTNFTVAENLANKVEELTSLINFEQV